MKIKELFSEEILRTVVYRKGNEAAEDVEIHGISIDSRSTNPGDIFFCIKGTSSDGHKYAQQAVENGAVAVVCSEEISPNDGALYITVADTTDELNRICNIFYGKPSEKMTIFAVTGTNGKTTIASVIKYVYSHKTPSGYMGTIGVEYRDYSRNASLTTPSQIEIHKVLSDMYDAGIRAAAIEASSHGLVQKRVESVDVDCAIFTQLTHEHLDYHGTLENYFEAKKLLFKNVKKDAVAVLNADDAVSIDGLKACCSCRYVTYGIDNAADYKAEHVVLGPRYTKFVLLHDGGKYDVKTNLIARYNISNILAVIASVCEMGMSLDEIIPLLEHIPQVAGRMEVIDEGQDYHVIVDFAHTPDAFEKVFEFAKEVIGEKANVYAVFGSSGRRDTTKRPVMGQIAGRYCNEIVTTQDDPRDEDPAEISRQIMDGIDNDSCRSSFIERRGEAIDYIISKAKKDDMVLLLGQGRQPYVIKADNYRDPYEGDHEAARTAIRRYMK